MPWDQIAPRAPELVALCLIVSAGGWIGLRMLKVVIAAQATYLTHITEVSKTCHASHESIGERTTVALEKVTSAVDKLTDREQKNELIFSEVLIVLRRLNGKGG